MRIAFVGFFFCASVASATNVLHHDIAATVVPGTGMLTVRDRITLGGDDSETPVRFLLHTGLTVSSVQAGNKHLDFSVDDNFNPKHFWERPDWAALAALTHVRELEIEPTFGEITIEYAGVIADSLHPPEEEYGRGFETTSGLIESRGAYLSGGTYWLPNVPDDSFTFTLTATVPSDWDAMSQGRLTADKRVDNAREIRFECDRPMFDAYLVAGPWMRRHRKHGDVDTYTYMYSDDKPLTDKYLDATARYLDRYESLIGPYPFSKFALVENFWETGYGMPSFTLLGSTVIRLPFIVHTSYGHEILHCWWGNGVFPDTESGNWSEGLTSFMADYAYKVDESLDAARDYRRNQLIGYRNYVSESRDFPLSAFRERHSGATQAVGYGKALMVFHMIEKQIGKEAFLLAVRDFYKNHQFAAASWHDFFSAVANVSNTSWDAFEAQWITRPGAPLLSVADVQVAGEQVDITLSQTERPFALSVPVEIELVNGQRIHKTMNMSGTTSTASFAVDGAPAVVRIDPDFDVFRRLHLDEIPPVLSQTLGADKTLIIIASDTPNELKTAYATLAETWSRKPNVTVIADNEVTAADLRDTSVWLFGDASQRAALFRNVGGDQSVASVLGDRQSLSWATTCRHPDSPTHSVSWLHVASADDAAALGRKIPHYGKYSYITFAGTKNQDKGVWPVSTSPMIVAMNERTQP